MDEKETQETLKKLQDDFDKLKKEMDSKYPVYIPLTPQPYVCPYQRYYNPCSGCSNYGTGKPCWCIKGSQTIY